MHQALTRKAEWKGPKHLERWAPEISKWPMDPFRAPVAEVKDFLDIYFEPATHAGWLAQVMDPYFHTLGIGNAKHTPDACPPGCNCVLRHHVTRLFVGRATPAQLAACQDALAGAVVARKAKAEKVAERNKAKRKAQKARKKAAAGATSNSEGESGPDTEVAASAGSTAVDPKAQPTPLIDAKTKTKTNHKDDDAGEPFADSDTEPKPVTTTVAHRTAPQLALRPNLLCPVCSPHTSLLCCFEDSATYDPVRDRRCRRCGH
ncbi:uncharacterized protein LOC62_07G009477 [Vanrija pseudolonga]|uniref:Uncharacterized protein n=1 Tax=Vanrija pseudolonga TaxID=143232 RepID=A0AAF0YKY6_9TREE|nr:hypothetical protein LOC62_07G009477 [Vanrija pseudolonga]